MKKIVGALSIALFLPALAWLPGPQAADGIIWLKVEVNDQGGEHSKVKVNVPLSLIEVVVDSIDKREFMANIESEHPSLDIPKLWREIRRMDDGDFVTIETDKENVRVWKDQEFFRINVREGADRGDDPTVEVRIPLVIMDYVFESKDRELDFQEMVERLRGHLPMTVVQVKHKDEHVRVWLEEE